MELYAFPVDNVLKITYNTIDLRFDSGVAHLTLNRPQALNPLNREMGLEIIAAFDCIEREAAGCVLLTGRGRAFCAGGDIKAMAADVDGFFGDSLDVVHRAITLITTTPRIVIAAVNGFAAGAGMSLALACDLRIAGESATFNQAFIRIGAVPDGGSTYHLPRVVGWTKAAELMLTGEDVNAREAERLGIVSRVVADAELLRAATEWARHIARGPTAVHTSIKKLLRASATATFDEQLDREGAMQRTNRKTRDFAEGVAAFMEKRQPKFIGS
jgi:2-(1,2-epoxy-1,2-dihydrophenyl)acetyl-CoA isomerase